MTTRFTDLTEIAAVDVDDADVMALSDVSASASRKVTVASLRTTVGAPSQDQATWNTGTDTTESTITAAKLTAKITNDVPTVIAGLTAGGIGTHVIASTSVATTAVQTFGATIAGSAIVPTGLQLAANNAVFSNLTLRGSVLSGTWRILFEYNETLDRHRCGLFVRIA